MSAHPHQRDLPSVGSRRLGKHWRARRAELLALERDNMLLTMRLGEVVEENRALRKQLQNAGFGRLQPPLSGAGRRRTERLEITAAHQPRKAPRTSRG